MIYAADECPEYVPCNKAIISVGCGYRERSSRDGVSQPTVTESVGALRLSDRHLHTYFKLCLCKTQLCYASYIDFIILNYVSKFKT